jgi:hypothetical protein
MTTDRLVALWILISLGVFCAAQIVIIIIHSIKRKARARNMPEKFKIIIIDNETGEELVNRDTDCIACAFSNGEEERDGKKGLSFYQNFLSSASFHEALGTLEAVNNLYRGKIDHIVKEYIKENPDSPVAKLNEFFDAMEREAKKK